ncbi:MAG: hypothetical protein QG602_426 [Verrucomicrobiota bacterium]|nr:hypothetical protein [Verrucomicrobiota bacterium]
MQPSAPNPELIRPCPPGQPAREWWGLAAEMQEAGIALTAENRPIMAALLDTQRQLAALQESQVDLEYSFSAWQKSRARDDSGQIPLPLSPMPLRAGQACAAQLQKLRRLSTVERVVEMLRFRVRTLRAELGMRDAAHRLRQPVP